jgi:hypothetical protein
MLFQRTGTGLNSVFAGAQFTERLWNGALYYADSSFRLDCISGRADTIFVVYSEFWLKGEFSSANHQ